MEYVKIHSLWKRQGWYFEEKKKANTSPDAQKTRQSFIIGDYAQPEFNSIKHWSVDEKIDGTNIRITFKDGKVSIGGRTANAQLPSSLLEYLQSTFKDSFFHEKFPPTEAGESHVILFGEGYGPKIQAGGSLYRDTPGFILFDVWANGWWLKRYDVKMIAEAFSVPMVPFLGIMTEDQIIEFVKSRPLSTISAIPQIMEGVVCRSHPLMLFRNGVPIIWKLKCKEFK